MSAEALNQTTGAVAPTGSAPNANGSQEQKIVYNFPVSDIPKNPLGEGKYIKTAAALIIGYVARFRSTSTLS